MKPGSSVLHSSLDARRASRLCRELGCQSESTRYTLSLTSYIKNSAHLSPVAPHPWNLHTVLPSMMFSIQDIGLTRQLRFKSCSLSCVLRNLFQAVVNKKGSLTQTKAPISKMIALSTRAAHAPITGGRFIKFKCLTIAIFMKGRPVIWNQDDCRWGEAWLTTVAGRDLSPT